MFVFVAQQQTNFTILSKFEIKIIVQISDSFISTNKKFQSLSKFDFTSTALIVINFLEILYISIYIHDQIFQ